MPAIPASSRDDRVDDGDDARRGDERPWWGRLRMATDVRRMPSSSSYRLDEAGLELRRA
jgi:hypothetical protein